MGPKGYNIHILGYYKQLFPTQIGDPLDYALIE